VKISDKTYLLYYVMMILAVTSIENSHAEALSSKSVESLAISKTPIASLEVASASGKCPSSSLWWNLPGPTVAVTIGNRMMRIPSALPNVHILHEGNINSVWFDFHVNALGQLSYGGPEENRPFLWEYLVRFFVIDVPGTSDDTKLAKTFEKDRVLDRKLSADVYPSVADDLLVGRASHKDVLLHCYNKFFFDKGKEVPACNGFDYPWAGVALTYTFGRQFLPAVDIIHNCIQTILTDFSK
jgi:hypothetical protein